MWFAVGLPLLTFPQILKDCIPEGVFKYISNRTNTPVHHHKSIILNLACGPSVIVDAARDTLLKG